MRNKLTAVMICLLSLATGYAQTTAEVKKQINEVKKKTGIYIYGEATAQTEQDARELAEEFLYDAINSWAASHKSYQHPTQDYQACYWLGLRQDVWLALRFLEVSLQMSIKQALQRFLILAICRFSA